MCPGGDRADTVGLVPGVWDGTAGACARAVCSPLAAPDFPPARAGTRFQAAVRRPPGAQSPVPCGAQSSSWPPGASSSRAPFSLSLHLPSLAALAEQLPSLP